MAPLAWGAEARSIQEFMTYQDKWEDFVVTDYVWHLEGRYAFIGDHTMQFLHCPLQFLISRESGRNHGGTGVVEVAGRLVKEDNKLVFRVEQLTSRPKDLDRVRSMRFEIESDSPEDWYRVASWARDRGKFYDDKELFEAARDLDRNGILTEFRKLNASDEDAMSALISKAREKQVGDDLVQTLVHQSLCTRLKNIRAKAFSDAAYRDLLVQISQELPGSNTPLEKYPAELAKQYAAESQQVYVSVDAEQRRVLDRLFFLEVTTERILTTARPDGSNGFEIADRLRSEAPERSDLANEYEKQALAAKMKKIDVSTRSQLEELTTRLDNDGKKDAANDARRAWLLAREPLFRQDGARGLVDLAQQWIALLHDLDAAAQLYIEAWRVNPQYTPASDWLTTHDYQLVNGAWYPKSEVPMMPVSPRELAIREGRVEKGMTATEVRSALGAVPTSITRLASSGPLISEWWVYKEAGVLVRLSKSGRDAESTVVDVERLNTLPIDEDKPPPAEKKQEE
jgi:hypothetical protein